MGRKTIPPDDTDVWDAETSDVVPLKKNKPKAERPAPALKKRKIQPPATHFDMPDDVPRTGAIDARTQAKLKRGEFAIAGRIDLHGMTIAAAHDALGIFISGHYHKKSRCVLVITGKGGKAGGQGQLQQEVPRWLSYAALARMVASYASAQPKHGGTGALYVLLKKV